MHYVRIMYEVLKFSMTYNSFFLFFDTIYVVLNDAILKPPYTMPNGPVRYFK